ncbi:CDP-diacylglycerol-serine O-phosphatidyltransferase [Rhodotorula kratochvilovae]
MPGTAAELTTPPVTGAPAQASSKASAPIDTPAAAKALAARRESTSVEEATKLAVQQATRAADSAKEDAVKLKEFVQDDRHFSLVRNFRLADCVTLGNGFCGALSLFSSAEYLRTNEQRFLWHALAYPLLGMIFDALDGKVARWRQESSMLGQELDSLADSISFGVAPALCAWTLGLRTPVDRLLLTLFICAGIARLARFNATVALVPKDATGKSKYFEGLPIPSSLLLCAAMALCVKEGRFEGPQGQGNGLPWGLVEPLREHTGVEVHWAALVFAGWAAAMVSKTLRIPKF